MNCDQAQRLGLALLDSGPDGVVVEGTTGEAPTLRNDEKVRLFKAVKEVDAGRGAVVVATGPYNTTDETSLHRDHRRS
jgi:4-hydroxy-tetrahydrodipicolinate synthase